MASSDFMKSFIEKLTDWLDKAEIAGGKGAYDVTIHYTADAQVVRVSEDRARIAVTLNAWDRNYKDRKLEITIREKP